LESHVSVMCRHCGTATITRAIDAVKDTKCPTCGHPAEVSAQSDQKRLRFAVTDTLPSILATTGLIIATLGVFCYAFRFDFWRRNVVEVPAEVQAAMGDVDSDNPVAFGPAQTAGPDSHPVSPEVRSQQLERIFDAFARPTTANEINEAHYESVNGGPGRNTDWRMRLRETKRLRIRRCHYSVLLGRQEQHGPFDLATPLRGAALA